MTQEEKKLLLIDLCAREPYHPRIQVFNQGYEGFQDGEFDTNLWLHHIDAFRFDRIEIWPYLRPMGSMTEEERDEFRNVGGVMSHNPQNDTWAICSFTPEAYDWLNKYGFDYRGLIEKGLALEEKNIK
jgi:hypothetical protein